MRNYLKKIKIRVKIIKVETKKENSFKKFSYFLEFLKMYSFKDMPFQ